MLEEKLRKLENECKLKEGERVNLELELTEVKESLKKAMSGGVTLGLAIEPKNETSRPQVWPLHGQVSLESKLFYLVYLSSTKTIINIGTNLFFL